LPAFLLHVASKVSVRHIEDAFDKFEREALTAPHYLLGRGGHCANYIITCEEPLERLHSLLSQEAAQRFALDWISLVEITSPWEVIEPPIAMPPGWGQEDDEEWPAVLEDDSLASPDHCGQLQRARTDENYFHPELIRVRTGLKSWLDLRAPHSRKKSERGDNRLAVAMLMHFHHPLGQDARWLNHLRAKLGRTSRPFMQDERSVVLTWYGVGPRELFEQPRFQGLLHDSRVHSVLCFKVGPQQKHTEGAIQAVVPGTEGPRTRLQPPRGGPPKTPTLIASRSENVEAVRLREALARLRGSQARRQFS
jgi:hypothetical protein